MTLANPDIAAVALNVPLDKLFHYRIPHHLRPTLKVGHRVRVPFGPRGMRIGVCVRITDQSPVSELKSIAEIVGENPAFERAMLDLTRWMADYYAFPWGQALNAALPAGFDPEAPAPALTTVRSDLTADLLAQRRRRSARKPRARPESSGSSRMLTEKWFRVSSAAKQRPTRLSCRRS